MKSLRCTLEKISINGVLGQAGGGNSDRMV